MENVRNNNEELAPVFAPNTIDPRDVSLGDIAEQMDEYDEYLEELARQQMEEESRCEYESYEWEREMIKVYEDIYDGRGYKFIERYKDNLCRLALEPSMPASEYVAAIEDMKAFLQKIMNIQYFEQHAINYSPDTLWLASLRINLESLILDYINDIEDSEYNQYKEDSIQWLKTRPDTELNKIDDMEAMYGDQIKELIQCSIGLRELLKGDGKEYKIFFIKSTMAIMARDINRLYKELDKYPIHLNKNFKNSLLGVEQGIYEIENYIEAFH